MKQSSTLPARIKRLIFGLEHFISIHVDFATQLLNAALCIMVLVCRNTIDSELFNLVAFRPFSSGKIRAFICHIA
tara:strand:- start:720 stop:944 length:225 start_codon:yes stop_codon:yes gene_type:complete